MTTRLLLVLSLLLFSSITCAQDRKYLGAVIYNGLPDTIVDARAARADNCERFICGEWSEVTRPQTLPLEPHDIALRYRLLPGDASKEDLVCRWDLKIVTLPADQGPLQEHIYRGFEICTPQPPIISFVQTRLGPVAVHAVQGQAGGLQATAIPSENSAMVEMLAAEDPGQSAIIIYNGLPDTIVEGYVAHADRCDVNACGEWQARGDTILPLNPHDVAAVLRLEADPENADGDCVWDIKIVTRKTDGDSNAEHIFKGLNFCTTSTSVVSFEQTEFGAAVIQAFKNQQDNLTWFVSPSRNP